MSRNKVIKTIKPSIYQLINLLLKYPKLNKYIGNFNYSLQEKYDFSKRHAKNTLKNLKLKVNIIGKENIPNENALFVANHTNYTDFLYILSAIDKPVGFIVAKEYEFKKVPLINNWMKEINCLFLDRHNPREGLKTIIQASNQLNELCNMCVFPEGTRHNEGILGEFKDGAFKIALKSNKPIVPIVIKGAKDSFVITKKKFLGLPLCLINPKEIEVEILPPIYEHINNKSIKTSDISLKTKDLMKVKLIEYNNKRGNISGI